MNSLLGTAVLVDLGVFAGAEGPNGGCGSDPCRDDSDHAGKGDWDNRNRQNSVVIRDEP